MQSIDIIVTNYLYGLASTNIWTEYIAIFLSDGIFVLAICLYVFVMYPLRKKKKYTRTLFHDIMPAVSTSIVVYIMKQLIDVDRPFVALGLNPFVNQPDPHGSFPSFHAAAFAAFAITLVFHHRKLGIFLMSLLPLVMIGRIAIGVHWLTDVLFGAFLGFSIAFRYYVRSDEGREVSFNLINRIYRKFKKN